MLFAHESQRAVMEYVTGCRPRRFPACSMRTRSDTAGKLPAVPAPCFMTIGRLSARTVTARSARQLPSGESATEDELREPPNVLPKPANSHKTDFPSPRQPRNPYPRSMHHRFSEMMSRNDSARSAARAISNMPMEYRHSGKHCLDIVMICSTSEDRSRAQVQMEFNLVSLNDQSG